jgi:hypothetical protein
MNLSSNSTERNNLSKNQASFPIAFAITQFSINFIGFFFDLFSLFLINKAKKDLIRVEFYYLVSNSCTHLLIMMIFVYLTSDTIPFMSFLKINGFCLYRDALFYSIYFIHVCLNLFFCMLNCSKISRKNPFKILKEILESTRTFFIYLIAIIGLSFSFNFIISIALRMIQSGPRNIFCDRSSYYDFIILSICITILICCTILYIIAASVLKKSLRLNTPKSFNMNKKEIRKRIKIVLKYLIYSISFLPFVVLNLSYLFLDLNNLFDSFVLAVFYFFLILQPIVLLFLHEKLKKRLILIFKISF